MTVFVGDCVTGLVCVYEAEAFYARCVVPVETGTACNDDRELLQFHIASCTVCQWVSLNAGTCGDQNLCQDGTCVEVAVGTDCSTSGRLG